jgi:hypothetical protein
MADFRIRGVITMTLLNDPFESVGFAKRWLELGDKALALSPSATRHPRLNSFRFRRARSKLPFSRSH